MISKLKKYKFSELYSMSSGISSKPEQAGHGNPFASFSTIFNNYFLPDKLPDLMDTSEKEQESYSIKKGDIFLTRTSETINELGISCVALNEYPKATFSGFVKRLRPLQNNVTFDKYMGFYLRSRFFRKTMTNNAVLTLRASLNEEIFSYLELFLPDFDVQKRIGNFLFLLNQKIAINNRINAELEAMAKTIYDYWFVQFCPNGEVLELVWNEDLKRNIPKGWKVGVLSDLANIIMGQSPSGESYNDNGEGMIFFQGSTDFGIRYPTIRQFTTAPTRFAKAKDILLSVRAPVGTMNIAKDDCCIGRGLASLRSKEGNNSYLLEVLKNLKQIFDRRNTDGTTFGSITKDDLYSLPVIIPETKILKKYQSIINPMFEKQNNLANESQQLSTLRDWLLPMLMNGQVLVN